MKKIVIFDINQKPKLALGDVAYLVDKSNVDLVRQYIDKYYQYIDSAPTVSSWTEWFDENIGCFIESNPDDRFILYFDRYGLGWDNDQDAVAYDDDYDIYYVVEAKPGKQLMKVE